MPFKQKSIETKDGRRYRVHESSIDKEVKAGPCDPRIVAQVRGQDMKTWKEERKRRSNSNKK
jgi:hypothetical protein